MRAGKVEFGGHGVEPETHGLAVTLSDGAWNHTIADDRRSAGRSLRANHGTAVSTAAAQRREAAVQRVKIAIDQDGYSLAAAPEAKSGVNLLPPEARMGLNIGWFAMTAIHRSDADAPGHHIIGRARMKQRCGAFHAGWAVKNLAQEAET